MRNPSGPGSRGAPASEAECLSAIHLFVTLVHRACGIAPETVRCGSEEACRGRLQIAAGACPSLPDSPTGRHAAGGAIGRFRPPAGSDGALRLRPCCRRTPPRRASSSRWCGSPRCRAGGGRRARDAPGALDANQPHQRRAAGTVRPHRHLPILGRRLVGLDGREVDRRRDDAIDSVSEHKRWWGRPVRREANGSPPSVRAKAGRSVFPAGPWIAPPGCAAGVPPRRAAHRRESADAARVVRRPMPA